jgi:hypothetical protein
MKFTINSKRFITFGQTHHTLKLKIYNQHSLGKFPFTNQLIHALETYWPFEQKHFLSQSSKDSSSEKKTGVKETKSSKKEIPRARSERKLHERIENPSNSEGTG